MTPTSELRTDTPVIELTDVSVERNHEEVLVVDHLTIPSGYTTLVGPNGSGKSTLLHLIAGLIEPRRGTVRVADPNQPRHRQIAYVLQSQQTSAQLLVTAGEVVALGRAGMRGAFARRSATDRSTIDDAMERMEVAELANRHVAEMSGGQRQRVFIAQGLAQRAPILLLDEPVAGLDAASVQVIRRAVDDERAAGRTVIVATHDLDEARRADHVVLLSGRVVAVGSSDDVLRPENLRAAYQGRVLDFGDGTISVDDDHHHHH
jgi:ABC-type Mn2+/Zn2+ transport system ATPase subunit